MSLDQTLRNRLGRLLTVAEDQSLLGPRLAGDATRLLGRVNHFIQMNLVGPQVDGDGLEVACYALQLPLRQVRGPSAGKPARTGLRDRCEQAAELLVSLVGGELDESLLDRAARLLHETPQRSPMLDEARLLADAVNLDDFGMIGWVSQAIQLALTGEGVAELAAGGEKREQYGYWEARLKDGFHFDQVRQIAQQRLQQARKVNAMLVAELTEDTKKL